DEVGEINRRRHSPKAFVKDIRVYTFNPPDQSKLVSINLFEINPTKSDQSFTTCFLKVDCPVCNSKM
ncbi:MAG: hypothetical protein RL664_1888, partial [Bacteroidota bacterium]